MPSRLVLFARNTVLFLACFFFILSASIMAPIGIRPFYYAHIQALDLPAQTGLSPDQIRRAYDEMLNFCLGLNQEFSTGVLAFSPEGQAHFEDVRGLFLLDFRIMVISGGILLLYAILRLSFPQRVPAARWKKHSVVYYSSLSLLCGFAFVGILGAIDFSRFFVVFHHVFFPGKDNWIFDPRIDEIIRILPEVFFRNCGICIVALILAACAGMIILEKKKPIEKQPYRND